MKFEAKILLAAAAVTLFAALAFANDAGWLDKESLYRIVVWIAVAAVGGSFLFTIGVIVRDCCYRVFEK
jgi:hypothetical protein